MHRRTHILVSAMSILMMAMNAAAQGPPDGAAPSPVRAAKVIRTEVGETRRVTGDLRAVSRSRVATLESGRVIDLPVDEGVVVTKGDALARLDSRRLEIQVQQLKAEEEVAQAVLDERKADEELNQHDFDAVTALAERNAARPKELADARSELAAATARRIQAERDLDVIKARRDLLDRRLADMTITAPFDGVVVALEVELGEWAGEGDTIVDLLAVGAYDAWLDVQQEYKPALMSQVESIEVEVTALDRVFPPADFRVIPQVDPTARRFNVLVRLDDPDRELAAGMSVGAWIPTGRRGQHMLVHQDALLENAGGYFVYVARSSGEDQFIAQPVQIQLLFDAGDYLAVRSDDLREGDMVIIEGNERLFPASPVQIVNMGEISADAQGDAEVTADGRSPS